MTFAVKDIANKLLHRAWMDESSELLSNMKFQKLLYYLHVLRATGDNRPMLGYREKDTFQVVFLETEFGDVYKH